MATELAFEILRSSSNPFTVWLQKHRIKNSLLPHMREVNGGYGRVKHGAWRQPWWGGARPLNSGQRPW